MVMGQEEKKNKTRLEKAQIALTSSNAEYEAAIKALEETTGRWNRDWKAACDVCSYASKLFYAGKLTILPEVSGSRGRKNRFSKIKLMDICKYLLHGLCERRRREFVPPYR